MGTDLTRVPEFGLLDALADLAWWQHLHGDAAEVLRQCDHGIAVAQAFGDEATVRYLMFTQGCALEEHGRAAEAVACADALLARTLDDARPYWQAKAIAVRALATRRSTAHDDAIDLLARAWVLVGTVDGRTYNQVSAAVVVANALRKVELYEQSDAQLVPLRRFVPASMGTNVVVDSVQALAEWALRLRVVGLRAESTTVFAMLASRVCLLRRVASGSRRQEHGALVRAAEVFAALGLGEDPVGLSELESMVGAVRGLTGRVGWLMATYSYASVLMELGHLDQASVELTSLHREASAHDWDVWVAAADAMMLAVAVARDGSHPALGVADDMYRRASQQLWRERQGRFAAVRRRVRIYELTAETARADELSTTDALTGVGNRRALDEWLAGMRVPTGGLFIDVDDFKSVNERTSHVIGDAVLVRVAELVAQCVRTTDLVARFGGDEFVVVIDSTVRQPWLERRLGPLAQRVVEAVRNDDWDRISPGLAVTVSVGLAVSVHAAGLLAALSESVGRVKRLGRDRADLCAHGSDGAR